MNTVCQANANKSNVATAAMIAIALKRVVRRPVGKTRLDEWALNVAQDA